MEDVEERREFDVRATVQNLSPLSAVPLRILCALRFRPSDGQTKNPRVPQGARGFLVFNLILYTYHMQKGIDFIGVTVSFFCHDGQGNYLFQKRGAAARDENGKWDCGGGGLEFGEKVADCLKKEVKEEYCADIIGSEFLGYYEAHRIIKIRNPLPQDGPLPLGKGEEIPSHWIALHFKVLIDPKQAKNGEPHKFDEIKWFKLDDLPPASELHSQLPAEIERYKGKL